MVKKPVDVEHHLFRRFKTWPTNVLKANSTTVGYYLNIF